MSSLSNRKRAQQQHSERVTKYHAARRSNKLGNASIDTRYALRESAPVVLKRDGTKISVLQSRLPKTWSDTYHKPAFSVPLTMDYWRAITTKPIPINPNVPRKNGQWILRIDPKTGRPVRTWHDLSVKYDDGTRSEHQSSNIKKLVMRGDMTLFDDCTLIDPRYCDDCPRSVIAPGTITTRKTGVASRYHLMQDAMPAYEVKPIIKPGKIALDGAVHQWRMAKQLAHALALIELGERN